MERNGIERVRVAGPRRRASDQLRGLRGTGVAAYLWSVSRVWILGD